MESSQKSTKVIHPEEWMVRPCDAYNEEYKDCISLRARFHQYFVNGYISDCSEWRKDYENCVRCNSGSLEHCELLIESEKKRRTSRLKAHYGNDVWEKRKQPPKNWEVPLPDKMQKAYDNSYLGHKARQMKDEKYNPSERSSCVIS